MLSIRQLQVEVDGKEILRGIDLDVAAGEVHAIMGPNGSGKSTLGAVLAGRDGYRVTGGSVRYRGQDLLALAPEERAREGVFLAFQYPVEIPGVSNMEFLRASVEAIRTHRGETNPSAVEFMKEARAACAQVNLDPAFLKRGVNEGFSGGEKKRNELMQMLLLKPHLALLDETDSGLDIDALQVVAEGVNSLRDPARAVVMVTHYQRLLSYVVPDQVHVLAGGRIVRSGGRDLALELEEKGYGWLQEDAA
ncbi:MAG: Fe-S cluster assembly ATPase SufC [Pseudomonadales bacterium]|nr:Fe-S cluster assembly ATPase SufC [Pseudomonadales bacterium]